MLPIEHNKLMKRPLRQIWREAWTAIRACRGNMRDVERRFGYVPYIWVAGTALSDRTRADRQTAAEIVKHMNNLYFHRRAIELGIGDTEILTP